MDNPLLSIAIPTFGQAPFLEKCLRSVAAQTQKVECMVCDAGTSFDYSNFSFVKVIRLQPDPGMAGCWSQAADQATTKYISFLADDNELEPQFAEVMVNFMERNPSCDLVFCNQSIMDEEGKIDRTRSQQMTHDYKRDILPEGILSSEIFQQLIQYNSIPFEACVMKSEVWKSFGPLRPEAHGALDFHFLTSLLIHKKTIGFISSSLMKFRVHGNSYSHRQEEKHCRGTLWAIENLKKQCSIQDQAFAKTLNQISFKFHKRLFRLTPSFKEKINLLISLIKISQ